MTKWAGRTHRRRGGLAASGPLTTNSETTLTVARNVKGALSGPLSYSSCLSAEGSHGYLESQRGAPPSLPTSSWPVSSRVEPRLDLERGPGPPSGHEQRSEPL